MGVMQTYPDIADEFFLYVRERSATGSKKPSSYVQAIHILNAVLNDKCPGILSSWHNLWLLTDAARLECIREYVLAECKKQDGGIFCGFKPESYWKNNYCSAALALLIPFQQMMLRKMDMLSILERSHDAAGLASELETFQLYDKTDRMEEVPFLNLDEIDGVSRMVIRQARENQQKFRTLVLWNYRYACCISGLPVRQSLQASHISDWSSDVKMRLNPTNGLCLAAHYHLAFDNHLIALDDDCRLVISKSLKEYTGNEAFREQFLKYEGRQIRMPRRFNPSGILLARHREQLAE